MLSEHILKLYDGICVKRSGVHVLNEGYIFGLGVKFWRMTSNLFLKYQQLLRCHNI